MPTLRARWLDVIPLKLLFLTAKSILTHHDEMRWLQFLFLLFLIFATGCATKAKHADTIFFLPGVAGDGSWYSGLRDGLRDGGVTRDVVTVAWGAPGPLFGMNFSNQDVHDDAEKKLAKILVEHQQRFPSARIDLLGHSAGCGVILGALAQLPVDFRIGRVVLLSPSVSPTYDLNPALARCDQLVVFVSNHDTTFLDWRTSHFGTYDRVKTKAAGNVGFDVSKIDSKLASRFSQHPYDPAYRRLGNDGGHFGATARGFVHHRISDLLK